MYIYIDERIHEFWPKEDSRIENKSKASSSKTRFWFAIEIGFHYSVASESKEASYNKVFLLLQNYVWC
ncbi:uncharacterized protein Gasu_16760 [Galdieria sulphuraria]|uniref:Uncharacterized protein n=1 Tax=Galdieria sulphuraria TaxID=130081 RepID=M2Y5E1_GALSU|nr:uncharacterized protein Gasu_16760 [Galdieria sulphuraria]EME31183.1 hypothetical protein Gasu_16760 [Galdieria sulphuraria]|eukprot:XP_005707703.1 hypothetical protein Gasu_16760 [Galdieria sulphuraria]